MAARRRRWLEYALTSIGSLTVLLGCLGHALTARLTRILGRDDDCWVFGARRGSGFVDNSRYLFEYVAEERPEVRAVWLSTDPETVATVRERGYEAYHARSLRGRWLTLRSGCVVVTHGLRDVSLALTGGAFVANLWHGVPLKTIGFDAELGEQSWLRRRAHRFVAARNDLVVSPSPMAVHQMATGLGVPRDRVRVLPYPRYDPLVVPEAVEGGTVDADAHERLAELRAEGRLVFYVPTFREEGADLGERVDFAALDGLLCEQDAHLVVKPHPYERLDRATDLDRVTVLDAVDDLSAVLPFADVLLTDYSSAFVDHLLLDRPQVFYAPDLDEYRAERGFYYDYESLVPGPVAPDDGELVTSLEEALTEDPDASRRRALRETFLTDTGVRPSTVVFAAIRAGLDDGVVT
ncbi:CDP-glycerol glycerophosphotransferase family protein [Halomarina salina]|uniref:CDP-glycerol glycerophosphotransferase family protein n=1 Tax=Halomarina salina TaxID=1872699 RepID=A0ABD5RNB4_9EURY|nr:CDP-glycerol glycerophosphotransferase family protein [Halomarina salina]